ncbi:MAG: FAD-dependent oxidoreductase, partial [Rickettsiales bacterium]|nr:FAD-dependent oxidoreductase [Rickettsiales bacterium]
MTHYDYFVIGAGSGGVSSSRLAASFGAKVGIAESFRVGGTCVIRGCVPKKLLVYASHFHEEFAASSGYGWDVGVNGFNWNQLIENKDKEIDRLNGIYLRMLENAGVTLHEGEAVFKDKNSVYVGDELITADTFLIATGGAPSLPEIEGIEHAITSNEAFHLNELPKSIAIVGGGYIAVEFAGILNGLGVETDIIYRGEAILRGFDKDVRHFLSEEMKKKGVTIKVETNITKIEKNDQYTIHLTDGTSKTVDQVMYCTGRSPNTNGLNLEEVGVQTDSAGAVIVDEESKTTQDGIYAVGDVTNRINLTPVAIKEG